MAIIPTATADNDGLFAVITVEDKEYTSDDEAVVLVNVFHNGEKINPDQEPLLVFDTDPWDDTEGREITTAKKDQGIYEASVPIFDSDLKVDDYGSVFLKDMYETFDGNEYALSFGTDDDTNTTYDYMDQWDVGTNYLRLDTEAGLNIRYEFKDLSDYPWGPGDDIEFKAIVTEGKDKVKPDEFTLEAIGGSDTIDIPFDVPETGIYEAEFSIPSDLEDATSYYISAYAEKDSMKTSAYIDINVDLYSIWFNELENSTKSDRAFKIYVSDMKGDPVEGATVTIFYNAGTTWWDARTSEDTTSTEGAAVFMIRDVKRDVHVSGEVSIDGEEIQYFSGVIRYGVEEGGEEDLSPDTDGFEVKSLTYTYEAKDDKVNHDFVAFWDEERVYKRDLYYYAYTDYEILGVGTVQTDGLGKFSLNIDAPADEDESIAITFKTDFEWHPEVFIGFDWEDTDGDYFSDLFEEEVGTDPEDENDYPIGYQDTDDDQFGDKYEIKMGTDPNDNLDFPADYKDTDKDGFGDAYEIDNGTDPNSLSDHPDPEPDNDNDGHSNEEEKFYGTNQNNNQDFPHNTYAENTDGDYIGSGYFGTDEQYDDEEIFYGTDPNDDTDFPYNQYDDDTDWDGVGDEEEKFFGTDPYDFTEHPKMTPDPWDPKWSDHNSTDGRRYEEDSLYLSPVYDQMEFISDKKVEISVDDFDLGGDALVTVKPDVDEGYYIAFWGLGNVDDMDVISPGVNNEWECWSRDGIEMYPMGGKYQGVFIAPSFLPDDEYHVVGGYSDGEGAHANHVHVKDGGSAIAGGEKEEEGTSALFWVGLVVIFLVIILVIVIVIIAVVIKSKGKKGAKEEEKKPGAPPPPPPPKDDKPLPPPPPS
jgi:hypothetical protein